MKWFGEPWPSADLRAPVCEEEGWRVPVPVGSSCLLCEEPIEAADRGVITVAIEAGPDGEPFGRLAAAHIECWIRQTSGPLAHLERRCPCFGGIDHETPGLTRRQEALAVMAWIYEHGSIA